MIYLNCKYNINFAYLWDLLLILWWSFRISLSTDLIYSYIFIGIAGCFKSFAIILILFFMCFMVSIECHSKELAINHLLHKFFMNNIMHNFTLSITIIIQKNRGTANKKSQRLQNLRQDSKSHKGYILQTVLPISEN